MPMDTARAVSFLSNIVVIPFWMAGLILLFFQRNGQTLSRDWLDVCRSIFDLSRHTGRSYYLAPAYPMLIAGGRRRLARMDR